MRHDFSLHLGAYSTRNETRADVSVFGFDINESAGSMITLQLNWSRCAPVFALSFAKRLFVWLFSLIIEHFNLLSERSWAAAGYLLQRSAGE